ncbi:MAG TPA: hypothetical protein VKG05_17020 [Steroidobacteraceae bacterium]|nr:hypothetical protein [Steroidobacteraceae bacterium]
MALIGNVKYEKDCADMRIKVVWIDPGFVYIILHSLILTQATAIER